MHGKVRSRAELPALSPRSSPVEKCKGDLGDFPGKLSLPTPTIPNPRDKKLFKHGKLFPVQISALFLAREGSDGSFPLKIPDKRVRTLSGLTASQRGSADAAGQMGFSQEKWKSHFMECFLEVRESQAIPCLGKTLGLYLMGMAGRFLPKLASKIKPSTAINRNWEKVTMFPHPGNCLQAWKDKDQSHSMENKHRDPIKGGNGLRISRGESPRRGFTQRLFT